MTASVPPDTPTEDREPSLRVSDWTYLAEGGANVILSHNRRGGDSPASHVLRVAKKPKSPSAAAAPPERMVSFVHDTMAPLLGARYLPEMRCVPVDTTFLSGVQAMLDALDDRPLHRLEDRVDLTRSSALLVRDATRLSERGLGSAARKSHAVEGASPTFCVEIKPKWGSLPDPRSHQFLSHPVKRQVCRYCMHQRLKKAQGKVGLVSGYCPLDLYSGEHERVVNAFQALRDVPQNNFRLYVDGKLVFPSWRPENHAGVSPDEVRRNNRLALEEVLTVAGLPGAGDSAGEKLALTEQFLSILSAILLEETVLQDLRRVQRLDVNDIEGIWERLKEHCGEGADVTRVLADDGELADLVQDFLLATSAKDCSIMIALRVLDGPGGDDAPGDDNRDWPRRVDRPGGGEIEYAVSVVDLDPKPVQKLRKYLDLDREIVRHFVRTVRPATPCRP